MLINFQASSGSQLVSRQILNARERKLCFLLFKLLLDMPVRPFHNLRASKSIDRRSHIIRKVDRRSKWAGECAYAYFDEEAAS